MHIAAILAELNPRVPNLGLHNARHTGVRDLAKWAGRMQVTAPCRLIWHSLACSSSFVFLQRCKTLYARQLCSCVTYLSITDQLRAELNPASFFSAGVACDLDICARRLAGLSSADAGHVTDLNVPQKYKGDTVHA